jgi:hypothetical protein
MDPVSITDALDHKYENARHNVYYPANANKLPTRFSARTKLPANQPTSIYPSYKCKLSLYSLLYRIEPAKIIARYDLHLENREAVVILLKLRTFIKEQVKFSSITLRPSVDLARVRQYYNIVRAFQREQCPTNSLDCFREGSYTVQNKHIL